MNTEHILSEGPLPMRCKHCGFGISTNPGAPLDRIADSVRGFLIMHRRCEKSLEPSKQVELFDPDMETEDECSARTVREEMRAAGHKPAGPRDHGISATTDEPDPETDPPGPTASWARYAEDDPDAPEPDEPELTAIDLPSHYDKFVELYPFALTHGALRDVLHSILTAEQYTRLPHGTVEAWHPSSVVFQEIAHWARVELAHANSVGRGEHIAGLTLPAQLKMPAAIEKAITEPKKVRKPRAPKRSCLRAEP